MSNQECFENMVKYVDHFNKKHKGFFASVFLSAVEWGIELEAEIPQSQLDEMWEQGLLLREC